MSSVLVINYSFSLKGEGDSPEAPAASGDSIYTSETRGSDEAGEGSYKVPYKTILQAMRRYGKEPFPVIFQVRRFAAKTGLKT